MYALMAVTSLLIATSFPVGEAIARGLDPLALTLVRFAIAAAVFAPIVAAVHGIEVPTLARLAAYGAISAALVGFFWCMFAALRTTTAFNTSVLYTTVPALSALFGAIIAGERLMARHLIALSLGLVGALWVIFQGDIDRALGLEFSWGDAVFLAGCVLMGTYAPLIKRLYRGEPAATMTLWVLITGLGWLLLLVNAELWSIDWRAVEPRVWGGIVYLAVITTIVTSFLTQYATVRLGPTRTMAWSYFYPVIVIAIDWAFGKEFPPPATLPGVAIVVATSLVVQSEGRSDRR